MTEQDYHKDSGYTSRKFVLSLIGILLIAVIGIVYTALAWPLTTFEIIASSTVTIVLGYAGISATRALIPKTAEHLSNRNETDDPPDTRRRRARNQDGSYAGDDEDI